jgi:dTDP-4-dehydrorhamnose 3,5-epimerase
MKFNKLPLEGAFLIELDKISDIRGDFSRAFCKKEFEMHTLETDYMQANLSTNKIAGTVRGMHFQTGESAEVKLVRCINGKIFDVIVDIRENSPTYLQHYGVELSASNGLMLYVPKGFAHGYQALTNDAAVYYMVSAYYDNLNEDALNVEDKILSIKWPLAITEISDKDRSTPSIGKRN